MRCQVGILMGVMGVMGVMVVVVVVMNFDGGRRVR